ncbi:lysophospholipid acyltransferase family protein [Ralstonia syzygii subsp. celebesensis]|uniref:Lauroyl acyltransferase n=3 Tax=Ralstonia solanacearum species complex TaxID=3116862 RepID=A0AAD0S948_RALSL|nr:MULTISPECIES: lysophospholipid acyltransferase family protein [Ralstonia solanacearum species complex]CCA80994.1 putative lipid A biosynthesis lauroyl acyltransferase [blood disease bacterium R229]AQW30420.1 lauroyl acyltransferase [blood disease bacterium A2-HR MARDI]AXV82906.1 lauroyl acyltransferase [Ralstonia solanacearum]AXW54023.1 lauroyl acyltransferase [Ralstonia solanacearum]QQV55749.1 lysophospholipid acyltransferase family protein [Ralstonia syzygii subsp. celebesensis]
MTFLFWLFSRWPLSWLQALGGWLGALAARVPGRYHDRLVANFRHAYPDVTPAMLKEAGRSAGRMVFEMPYFWMRRDALKAAPGLLDDCWTTCERLLENGRGVIFLTPHLGCFEVAPLAYAQRWPITAMFKPPRQERLRTWIETMRTRPNMRMAPADPRGVRMVARALKRGEAVGILPDQAPTTGEGVWAPFFGKPAYTMTLVHRLQRLSGAPVAVLFCERLPRGTGYRLHLRVIGTLPEDVTEAAGRINHEIEQLIALAPTQYLWGYNRYKRPKGVDAPEPAAPPSVRV